MNCQLIDFIKLILAICDTYGIMVTFTGLYETYPGLKCDSYRKFPCDYVTFTGQLSCDLRNNPRELFFDNNFIRWPRLESITIHFG